MNDDDLNDELGDASSSRTAPSDTIIEQQRREECPIVDEALRIERAQKAETDITRVMHGQPRPSCVCFIHVPVCEPRDPLLSRLKFRQDTFESLLDVQTGTGSAGQGNFGELFLQIRRHDVGPFDAVLSGVVIGFVA